MALDSTFSPRLEELGRRKKKASEAAADLKTELIEEMTGSIIAQQEATTQETDNDAFEGAYELARSRLQSPRVKTKEAADKRSERRQSLRDERQREAPKPAPAATGTAAASLNNLSPAQFKAALKKAFTDLDVDQCGWLVEIAAEAESAAWGREADPDPVTPMKGPEDFPDELSYSNYVAHQKFLRADDADDDDEDELTGLE